jgi:hypothetical protein
MLFCEGVQLDGTKREYLSGGPNAKFNSKIRDLVLDALKIDWSKISPAIFGDMLQLAMDKGLRRELGAHYTSEENILKLINPLFMDDLGDEFHKVKGSPKDLKAFHEKISSLRFLDPACGCGNFLIISFRELRLLELKVIQTLGDYTENPGRSLFFKTGPEQFYGIEIEEFSSLIANLGLWLTDHQTKALASKELGVRVGLHDVKNPAIIHGNALSLDWGSVIAKTRLSYILGNPPFVGYSNQSAEQKRDIVSVCGLGKVDYVAGWYFKAVDFIQETDIKCAFVSTNSITQGEQAALVWKPLMDKGARINFTLKTFKWTSVGSSKAVVHCVIIGFSLQKLGANINQYLIEAPTVYILARKRPLCEVPPMAYGNKLVDGGFLTLTLEERRELIKANSSAEEYIRPLIGSAEFLKNKQRYCLWLTYADLKDFSQIPQIMERVEKVREFRLKSKKKLTRKWADSPFRFVEIRQPNSDYLLIPRISSENRLYIPMGFVSYDKIVSDSAHTIPMGTLYHFGVLTSSVHMAWVGAVSGRLEMRYRYSSDIVYNNFPWPYVSREEKSKIERAAKRVIDIRKNYPDSALADLYDPIKTPKELSRAHQNLDELVLEAYKFSLSHFEESKIVAKLMELYQKLTS